MTIKPPDQTYMSDFVGIGFKGGVEITLEVIRALYPDLTIDIDIDELRAKWAEQQAGTGELLEMNGRSMVVTHAWAFRLIAATFLDYMEQAGADKFIRQEIEITPSLTSGMEGVMVEVSRLDWWRKNKRKEERRAEHEPKPEIEFSLHGQIQRIIIERDGVPLAHVYEVVEHGKSQFYLGLMVEENTGNGVWLLYAPVSEETAVAVDASGMRSHLEHPLGGACFLVHANWPDVKVSHVWEEDIKPEWLSLDD